MGNEKQHRDDQAQQKRPHHDKPASTDMADAVADQEAARAASAHQRKHAGVTDERFGKGALSDPSRARIIEVFASGEGSRITIAAGRSFGVRPGMEGYVTAGQNMLADFQIDDVNERVSYAYVDVAPDAVMGQHECIVNTTTRPPAGQDVRGRIIAHAIEGDRAKLTIAAGADRGVRKGMKGHLDGVSIDIQFTVVAVHARVCFAYVKFHSSDALRNAEAIVNPTSAPQVHKTEPSKQAQHSA